MTVWLYQSSWMNDMQRILHITLQLHLDWALVILQLAITVLNGSNLYVLGILSLVTWCCTERCHLGKSVAACYQWWPRGNWLLSRLQRINQVSRWSPTWMDPDQGSHLGIRCTPGEGHSIFAVEIHWACSPVEELRVVNGKYIISESYSTDGELRSGSFCSSDLRSFCYWSLLESILTNNEADQSCCTLWKMKLWWNF